MRIPLFRRALPGALVALFGMASLSARADVVCHYTYGGETKTLRAVATDDPLRVRGTVIGSYFQLRVVVQTRPADLAAVKIYTYADRDDDAHDPARAHRRHRHGSHRAGRPRQDRRHQP